MSDAESDCDIVVTTKPENLNDTLIENSVPCLLDDDDIFLHDLEDVTKGLVTYMFHEDDKCRRELAKSLLEFGNKYTAEDSEDECHFNDTSDSSECTYAIVQYFNERTEMMCDLTKLWINASIKIVNEMFEWCNALIGRQNYDIGMMHRITQQLLENEKSDEFAETIRKEYNRSIDELRAQTRLEIAERRCRTLHNLSLARDDCNDMKRRRIENTKKIMKSLQHLQSEDTFLQHYNVYKKKLKQISSDSVKNYQQVVINWQICLRSSL